MLINSYLTFSFFLFPMTTSLQLGSLNMNGNIGNESYFELRRQKEMEVEMILDLT